MSDFPTEEPVGIARRLEIRGENSSSWMAVLSPLDDSEAALSFLVADLASLLQRESRVLDLRGASFEDLRFALHSPEDDIVIFNVRGDIGSDEWGALDIMRSALERPGPVVFWISLEGFGALAQSAPNIRSFIGPSVFAAGVEGGIMSEQERLTRLEGLSQHYGFDGAEVIRRAEAGQLPQEQPFAEWLVLLGRGDLV